MKNGIGAVLILLGIGVGLWAGVWWAFIGGIVQVVEAVKAPELNAVALALGIARTLFAGAIGWLSGLALILPGVAMLNGRVTVTRTRNGINYKKRLGR